MTAATSTSVQPRYSKRAQQLRCRAHTLQSCLAFASTLRSTTAASLTLLLATLTSTKPEGVRLVGRHQVGVQPEARSTRLRACRSKREHWYTAKNAAVTKEPLPAHSADCTGKRKQPRPTRWREQTYPARR